METKPFVGQKVKLNNSGLEVLFDMPLGLSHLETRVFTVTRVGQNMTSPEGTYLVDLDDPEISLLMLTSDGIDPA